MLNAVNDCLSSSFCVDNAVGLIAFIGSTAGYFNLLENEIRVDAGSLVLAAFF